MRTKLFILFIFIAHLSSCQSANYDKQLVEGIASISVLEAPFMVDELIEMYRKDTLCIKRLFDSEIYSRTEYTRYCYNICTESFYNKLLTRKVDVNSEIIEQIIYELDYDKEIIKPQINWGNVFETCQTCPFGEYPDERFFYFRFSVIFMEVNEIKEMISFENGQQWKYALLAIKAGDAFTLNKEEDYKQYVLDRRMAAYVMGKWNDSEIPEIQQLLALYKSIM